MKTGTSAQRLRVLSAGSLRHAMTAIAEALQLATGLVLEMEFGPAGLLRERIETGANFDLFASANLIHPQKLRDKGLAGPVTCFAGNRLCIVARANLDLRVETFLQILDAPHVRLATSTPGADPSGDYALEFFELVESRFPGLGERLRIKSRHLVGGSDTAPVPPGLNASEWLIENDQADAFLGYASSARSVLNNPELTVLPVPPEFGPKIGYGLCLRPSANSPAEALRSFILSLPGQQILVNHGFISPS